MQVGDLVRLHGYLERNEVGMVMRYNPRYNSYTIYWIATGEICAKCTYDVVKL